ncbi:protein abhd-3.2-like [Amblyomma americanum]
MGVVSYFRAPSKGQFLLCTPCAAQVFYHVLTVRKLVCRSFVKGYFRNPVWCTDSNLQRLVGSLYHRWLPRVNYCRDLLVLSDRGLVALDWLNEDRPGSQNRQWHPLLPALAAVGFPCLVVNRRGCGVVPLAGHRLTYAAIVSDFAEVMSKVRKPYRRECPLAAGVFLGGPLLSLHLCQRGPEAQLDAALAVSPPFEPAVAARTLSYPWGCNLQAAD